MGSVLKSSLTDIAGTKSIFIIHLNIFYGNIKLVIIIFQTALTK